MCRTVGGAGCAALQYIEMDIRHVEHDQLRLEQGIDEELKKIIAEDSEGRVKNKFCLINNLYCNTCEDVAHPFIPVSMRKRVFHLTHNIVHCSIARTLKLVTRQFFWPNMKKDVRMWTKSCAACQAAKVHRHNIAPVITLVPASDKFESVHIDFVGPLPHCNGYEYMMTALDRYSRWVKAVPLTNSTTETTADCSISNWVLRFRVPESRTTDWGRNFQSYLFNRLLEKLGCKHYVTTSYHPEHNGIIERALNKKFKVT